ncbi:MAG: hypothetical protein COX19_03445 [Desulfobacterales bacterium CG23_combo_of_CG06-09_8_20_14_all_51_8]|nr:MAG: hypothetical protein COX19_03445 [Desulfobacterales bacterium CG23_combo_of_CG06-09_8_20_14_all_51_8]
MGADKTTGQETSKSQFKIYAHEQGLFWFKKDYDGFNLVLTNSYYNNNWIGWASRKNGLIRQKCIFKF